MAGEQKCEREDLLLRSMADQQAEFERFRENFSERLVRLERKRSRSEEGDDFGFGPWMKWAFIAAIVISIAPMVLELFTRLRAGKENASGNLSLPQA